MRGDVERSMMLDDDGEEESEGGRVQCNVQLSMACITCHAFRGQLTCAALPAPSNIISYFSTLLPIQHTQEGKSA